MTHTSISLSRSVPAPFPYELLIFALIENVQYSHTCAKYVWKSIRLSSMSRQTRARKVVPFVMVVVVVVVVAVVRAFQLSKNEGA